LSRWLNSRARGFPSVPNIPMTRTDRVFLLHILVYLQELLPGAATRQALANELGLSPHRVQVWFQNRRAKARQKEGKLYTTVNNSGTPCPLSSSPDAALSALLGSRPEPNVMVS
jgi:hypothetical protein